jgi:hypothetical protein
MRRRSRRPRSAREVLALIRTLPPEEQENIRRSLNADPTPTLFAGMVPVTITEAAKYLCKNRSTVSRACANGKLPTNGKQGHELRVCLWAVLVASAEEIVRCLKRHGRYSFHRSGEEQKAVGLAEELLRELRAFCPGGWPRADDLDDRLDAQLEKLVDAWRKRRSPEHSHTGAEKAGRDWPPELWLATDLLLSVSKGLEEFPLHNKS